MKNEVITNIEPSSSHLNVIPSTDTTTTILPAPPQVLTTAKKSSKITSPKSVIAAEQPNPYLLLRESKIARNENRLAKLGLANTNRRTPTITNRDGSTPSVIDPPRGRSLQVQTTSSTRSTVVMVPRTRRSSRLRNGSKGGAGAGEQITRGGVGGTPSSSDGGIDGRGGGRSAELQSTDADAATRKRGRERPISLQQQQQPLVVRSLEPGFTRSTEIDVHTILFGRPYSTQDEANREHTNQSHHHRGMIGKRLKYTGKATVVNSSATLSQRLSDDGSSSNGMMLRFNKYSGICEWKDDVIFLWVNIGAPKSEVVNKFLQGGRQITWFGGSRMHQHTPAIQKLLRIGISNHRESNSGVVPEKGDGSSIVLWCRMYDRTKRTFLPYTCLGRVGYRSHDPDVHPIKFVWDLLDYKALMAENVVVDGDKDDADDLERKNAFQQMIAQADR